MSLGGPHRGRVGTWGALEAWQELPKLSQWLQIEEEDGGTGASLVMSLCVPWEEGGGGGPLSPWCPPPLPPLLPHPSTRSVKPPCFCPAGNSRFFAGFFHLTQSQGSKSSCFQGREAGPSLGRGSSTRKKEVYLFSLPKQSSGVQGEALSSCLPTLGHIQGGVGSHKWLRGVTGWPRCLRPLTLPLLPGQQ